MQQMNIPRQVEEVASVLAAHYYEAYLAGECVRELLTDSNPLDFDIITNAEPERLVAIFEPHYKINTDNEADGEIIVFCQNVAIGVASYKSGYTPDGKPIFTQVLLEELERRDFTINAIAYSLKSGLYDPFNAVSCLSKEQRIIRAIGEANALLDEASRERRNCVSSLVTHPINILKAAALYASGEYVINEYTINSMLANSPTLAKVSPRELVPVLEQVLLGKRVSHVLAELSDVIFSIIPELRFSDGFEQYSRCQEYPLWEHVLRAVGYSSPDLSVRYALLFHALGKEDCFAMCEKYATYYGHTERACIYAGRIMKRLKLHRDRISEVLFLISHHDDDTDYEIAHPAVIAAKYGAYLAKKLMLMQSANIRAKSHDNEKYAATLRSCADRLNAL